MEPTITRCCILCQREVPLSPEEDAQLTQNGGVLLCAPCGQRRGLTVRKALIIGMAAVLPRQPRERLS